MNCDLLTKYKAIAEIIASMNVVVAKALVWN